MASHNALIIKIVYLVVKGLNLAKMSLFLETHNLISTHTKGKIWLMTLEVGRALIKSNNFSTLNISFQREK